MIVPQSGMRLCLGKYQLKAYFSFSEKSLEMNIFAKKKIINDNGLCVNFRPSWSPPLSPQRKEGIDLLQLRETLAFCEKQSVEATKKVRGCPNSSPLLWLFI